MYPYDDDLENFEAHGAPRLPTPGEEGHIASNGSRIWYATYGVGEPVILLHGGLGHSGNWGYQVPALVNAGRRVVVIDSRGHGRSTRDAQPFTYELMASDVLAVMDATGVARAAIVGWSDGACTGLILAMRAPARVTGVIFFGCNMDPTGAMEVDMTNVRIKRCFARHTKDYAQLSPTPDQFKSFVDAVSEMMKTQPNYSASDLSAIHLPVAIVQSENDEFIKREHAEYLARSIEAAELIIVPGVSHFAPLQRPDQFNAMMLDVLARMPA